ncbi:MAG: arsenic efflux protein [Deltaproteobacteria bacterium]|nr:arsenic efflux protein [Deltaproteobacteria bacterium]
MIVLNVLRQAVLVSASVAVMMLVIEYANVQTRGALMTAIGTSRWRHYLIAVLLGAVPGCFGAYAVVALHTDRRVSLGAVTAAMVATAGDEMFVMLALYPATAMLLTLCLAALGLAAGWATDRAMGSVHEPEDGGFSVHPDDDCDCFQERSIIDQWRRPREHRIALVALLVAMAVAVATGAFGPQEWEAERIALLALFVAGLFIVATVPDHFLDEHLWNHVALEHVPRIFVWTLGAFAAVALLTHLIDLEAFVASQPYPTLALASALGVIPESGPHLVFVTLFDRGAVPFSVLLANSAVQDGHGMLPLLAHSRVDFLKVKAVNLIFGLAAGALLMALGG